jgi:hypothetical protein
MSYIITALSITLFALFTIQLHVAFIQAVQHPNSDYETATPKE